jgi:hypothetical protein
LRIYDNGPDLEQEFLLRGQTRTKCKSPIGGSISLHISEDGSLEVNTAFGTLRETTWHCVYSNPGGGGVGMNVAVPQLSAASCGVSPSAFMDLVIATHP